MLTASGLSDNLSTHNPSAFYRFFSPEEARNYLTRFEFYFTPTHGSWLNMAELAWSSLQTQCLNRRIPDAATLKRRSLRGSRAKQNRCYDQLAIYKRRRSNEAPPPLPVY